MEDTFFHCEISAMNGESKFCATSLESMLEWAQEILGFDTKLGVYTTDFLKKSPVSLQNYTILQKPKEILVPKLVACHTLPYPYAVFYYICKRGRIVIQDFTFGVLKVQPGSSPVCHFFPADNLVWVPSSSM
ncbi:hypothetical protein HAX54_010773 [Datura stramonium]|uniref:BURP domain-containing protein n=1 Tax=Datura stramonium TaxID=4076 RepID=A0ABS8RIG3_DATST|nr:hypothetical protein [Datura stramonium]